MLRKSKNFISMPVVSLEDGQEIGSVKGLVINPEKRIVSALVIDQKGWFKEQRVIPYTKVHSVGDDAITIEKSNSAAKWTSLSEVVQLVNQKVELIGAKVVTERGTVLGYVNEYFVDEENGEITALDISGRLMESLMKGRGQLPMAAIRTLGKDALIAVEGAAGQFVKMDGGLKETFSTIKENTSHFWENTWQKTKELSKSLPIVGSKEHGKNGSNGETIYEAASEEIMEEAPSSFPDEKMEAIEENTVEEKADVEREEVIETEVAESEIQAIPEVYVNPIEESPQDKTV